VSGPSGPRVSYDYCRHPILYLPISGIADPNDNTTLVYQKTTLSSEPERRFGKSPNSNQSPKAQTGPSEHMHPSKRSMHPPRGVRTLYGCVRHFDTLKDGPCTSKWRTPLQRGVHLLSGSVCKVETNPQNCSISIPISISHIGELTMVN
jgi:hypothetical protein